MILTIKRINKAYLLLFLILLFAAFLRFWRLSEMAYFDTDQEYSANFAYSVLREFPIQLIGQGISVKGLFLGPLYFYYLVPFFLITNLHPIGGFVGSVIFGLATIITYFFVANNLFGPKAGLIAAFLRSILYVELHNDWGMTSAFASELPALLTWWFFYRYWHGKLNILPALTFVFGFYTSIHPILFPFYFVFLSIFIVKRKLPQLKIILLSVVTFLIPISPLILFEFLHNFLEIKQLITLFTHPSPEANLGFSRLLDHLALIATDLNRILGLQFVSSWLLWLFTLAILGVLIFKKVDFWKNNFHKFIVPTTFVIFLAYYTFFPSHVTAYYFVALTTIIILYAAANLGLLVKNFTLLLVLFLILANTSVMNLGKLVERWENSLLSTLYHKEFIVREIVKRQPQDQEFYVSYITRLGWNTGFSYLFKYYQREPQTKEVKQPIYTIVLPKSLSPASINISSGDVGLILPH